MSLTPTEMNNAEEAQSYAEVSPLDRQVGLSPALDTTSRAFRAVANALRPPLDVEAQEAWRELTAIDMSCKHYGTTALFYLATPYSKFEGGHDKAFVEAGRVLCALMSTGFNTYSPIVHGHVAKKFAAGKLDNLPLTWWLNIDEAYMRASNALIVAHIPGWDASEGIHQEIAFFNRARKPVIHLPLTDNLVVG